MGEKHKLIFWLTISLVLASVGGCTSSQAKYLKPSEKLTLATSSSKTVRITVDPQTPEAETVAAVLRNLLTKIGYQVVNDSPDTSYAVQLRMLHLGKISDYRKNKGSFAHDATAFAGQTAGSAISGTAGVIGGLTGIVVGNFLRASQPDYTYGGLLLASFTDPSSASQQKMFASKVVGNKAMFSNPSDIEKLRQQVVQDLAYQLASVFPGER